MCKNGFSLELVNLNIGVISYRVASSELEEVYLNLIKETV